MEGSYESPAILVVLAEKIGRNGKEKQEMKTLTRLNAIQFSHNPLQSSKWSPGLKPFHTF